MHRQSLSSPASKHGIVVGAGVIKDDNITSEDLQNQWRDKLADDQEHQSEKPPQPKSISLFSSVRLIHLIPLLTLFCFFVLYLASHDPSRKDLTQFGGFTTLSSSSKKIVIDSTDFVIEKKDILAIGGTKSLLHKPRLFNRRSGN